MIANLPCQSGRRSWRQPSAPLSHTGGHPNISLYVASEAPVTGRPTDTSFSGQILASHLYRPFQHIHVLETRKQLHRHAVEAVLRLHDADHLSASDPAIAAALPALPQPVRVSGGQLQDLFVVGLRGQCNSPRNTICHRRGVDLLQLLVLGCRLPTRFVYQRLRVHAGHLVRAVLCRIWTVYCSDVSERAVRVTARPCLLHICRFILRHRGAISNSTRLLASLDVLGYPIHVPAGGVPWRGYPSPACPLRRTRSSSV